MKTLLITGYTAFDLGIFDEKDIKIKIIKKPLKEDWKRIWTKD